MGQFAWGGKHKSTRDIENEINEKGFVIYIAYELSELSRRSVVNKDLQVVIYCLPCIILLSEKTFVLSEQRDVT